MNPKENVLTLPVAIILAAIIIGGAVFFSRGGPTKDLFSQPAEKAPPTAATDGSIVLRPVSPTTDHILGNPDATLLIVEYTDLECPFCKIFNATMHRIMDEYGKTGKVAWVFRHFPIASLHPKAHHEAEAAECAYDQGGNTKFWAFTDKIFEITPSNNGLDPAALPIIAREIGLNTDQFNTCLGSGKNSQKIDADYQDGLTAGVDGTPYSVIIGKDGKKSAIHGAQPYEVVKAQIDGLLSGK